MKINKRELAIAFQPRLREVMEGQKESRTIEGYALKWSEKSVLLCDWYDNYQEVLEPGCITREVLDASDIKMTMFHNREKILARSNKGEGTLSYEIDEVGVKFCFDAPKTSLGDEAIELVRRGDIAGCSFAYSTNEDSRLGYVTYEEQEDGTLLRHVNRIEAIYDFTLAADPAYQQTSVSKREVDAFFNRDDEAERLKIAEEAKQREKKIGEAVRSIRDAASIKMDLY